MFSLITKFDNQKTKGHTLIKFFTAQENWKSLFLFDNYRCSMCAVSTVVHTSNILVVRKKNSVFLWLWTIPLM